MCPTLTLPLVRMRCYIHAQLGDIVRQRYFLPRSIAIALADCTSASVPLGLTPSVTWGCSRVALQWMPHNNINGRPHTQRLPVAKFLEMLRCADWPNIFQRIVYRFATQNSNFLVNFRIPHMQPHQKAVQLGFRQGLRSHTAQRILRSDDQMGLWQGIGLSSTVTFLLPSPQQRRLGLAGGPVDLVRQQEVAEQCARLKHKFFRAFHRRKTGQIRGQHIRRKLHPAAAQPQRLETPWRGRLAHARHILHQHVTAEERRSKHFGQNQIFPDTFRTSRRIIPGVRAVL